MFVQNRESSRGFFFEVWRKHQAREPLEPLQQLVLGVILEHPEYHGLLQDAASAAQLEFDVGSGNSNPFLHMGMHIAIKEQVQTDRPPGIRKIFLSLCEKHQEQHKVEHKLMECLGSMLWQAQMSNRLPDEDSYLECLKELSSAADHSR